MSVFRSDVCWFTELLFEAAVRLWVSDGGADDDIRRRPPQDVRQQLHQAGDDVGVVHHVCAAGQKQFVTQEHVSECELLLVTSTFWCTTTMSLHSSDSLSRFTN